MPSASASMLVAPKETPASTMNVLPSARTARPISPEVVPESRDGVDVDDGDVRDVGTFVEKHGDLGRARSLFESRLELLERNVRTREHAAGGFSAGAVADDEHTALLRDERRERSFEREGAGTRHQDSGVFGGTHARDTQETTAHVLHHRDECGISGRRTAGHGLEDGCFNGDGAGREQPAGIDLSFHDLQRSFVQSRMRGIIERLHDETTADE
ncbi:MAG: hypothetical protein ACLR8J_06080 [Sutterella wadsworthensis]